VITLRTPWDAPILRSNDRMHWARKAKITRQIRDAARLISEQWLVTEWQGDVIHPPVIVTLVWEVTDKRKRDVGASSPFLKGWIDGMVDAGLLRADSHDVVAEERLRIEVGNRKGVRIEITPAKEQV